jgi:membrane protease YdiL (CAAX protease family)
MPGFISVYARAIGYNENLGFIVTLIAGLIIGYFYERKNRGL